MKRIYEQMLEIAVRNPELLTSHQDDLIIYNRNQLKNNCDSDEKWIWILKPFSAHIAIISDSIAEYMWDGMPQEDKNATCNWGFPYIRETLMHDPKAKAFVVTVTLIDDHGEPVGTIEEVSHDDALRLLACDRCLDYWQQQYPNHPMHLELHRLKQSS
jgi:hypothetical protein